MKFLFKLIHLARFREMLIVSTDNNPQCSQTNSPSDYVIKHLFHHCYIINRNQEMQGWNLKKNQVKYRIFNNEKNLGIKNTIWVEIQIMILAFFKFGYWMDFSVSPSAWYAPPPTPPHSPHKVWFSWVQLSPSSNEAWLRVLPVLIKFIEPKCRLPIKVS